MKQYLKEIQAFNPDSHVASIVKAMPPSGIRKFFDLVNEMESNLLGGGRAGLRDPMAHQRGVHILT